MTSFRSLVIGALLVVAPACKNAGSASSPGSGGVSLADGKYEHVTVEGRVVPMIHVMNKGTVVLVDTDGRKPRDWEEQYKRKGSVPPGVLNIHKTNVNRNDSFDDDPVDREGYWIMNSRGDITRQ